MLLDHTVPLSSDFTPAAGFSTILPEDDRRREPRYATDNSAHVRSLNPLRQGRLPARVLDVSRSGMRLRTDTSFDPGTLVHIQMKKSIITGEIRFSKAVDSGFEHGVAIESILRMIQQIKVK